jgi:two-component system NarL family sensor kinase
VTSLASSAAPARPATGARAVPVLAGVCVLLVVGGLGSYLARGAPLQDLYDAWVFQNAPVALGSVTVFGLALRRRPRNPAAWAFFLSGVASSVHVAAMAAVFATADRQPDVWAGIRAGTLAVRDLPASVGLPLWIATTVWLLSAGLAVVGLLHFPDGRLPSPRWRPARALLLGGLAVAVSAWAWAHRPWSPYLVVFNYIPDDPVALALFRIGMPLLGVGTLLTVASLVVRLRTADPDERRRVRPVVIAATMFLSCIVVLYPWQSLWAAVSVPMVILLIIAIAGSVTRHQLFDVEVVVSRAVTVAVLGAVVSLTYVGLVAGIGALLGRGSQLWLSVAATAVIAVAFEPLRRRTLRLATRLVLGTHTPPEELLETLSDQLARADSTDEVLDRVADLLLTSTGAERVEVRIRRPDGVDELDGAAGGTLAPDAPHRVSPIVEGGETLGEVRLLASRAERFLPADDRLLRRVAAALGPVARNVRLTRQLRQHIDELHDSRRRIVTAHDDARRTLERDIHDGAQQQLLALRLQLGLATTLAERDGADAVAGALADAAERADDAIRRLRRLARGLYPPVLAEQGLVPALRAHARDVPLPVTVDALGVGRYDRTIEAAVYFCCLEAMQNASRHADASALRIELVERGGVLAFAVMDDGAGFAPPDAVTGSGLANMVDRIEGVGGELAITAGEGGGTTVRGRVPLPAVDGIAGADVGQPAASER